MKAITITKPGGPEVLRLTEKPTPEPGDKEVLIRVKAAGVNRPDVFQRKGNYPPPPGAPEDIPGLEVAGIIERCENGVIRWKKGDEVCALLTGGGYAEYVTVNEGLCLPVPESLSFTEAAALPETVFTVWHNVFQRGKLKYGENFLVHGGSSGIGTTAIQLAYALGARIYATAGTDEKCKRCEQLGADRCINYKKEDFEKILGAEGVDVILDMVGGAYIPAGLRILRPEGRMVFINTVMGSKVEVDIADIMRKRLTVTGSTLRPRDISFKSGLASDIEKNVWPLILQQKFRPIIYRTFSIAEAAAAHSLLESSEHIGKIVLSME